MTRGWLIFTSWTGLLLLGWAMTWASDNDHNVLAVPLGLVIVVVFWVAKVATFGATGVKDQCRFCKGKVKAGAVACSKCGRVVRKATV